MLFLLRPKPQFVDLVDDLTQVVAAGDLVLDLAEDFADFVFNRVRPAGLLLETVQEQTQPLSDGVMFLRYLAGFTGTTPTAGVANPQDNRTNRADIVTWYADYRKPLADFAGEFCAVRHPAVRLASTPDAVHVTRELPNDRKLTSTGSNVVIARNNAAEPDVAFHHDPLGDVFAIIGTLL